MCGPAKYGEASAKTSHDQPYVHMISYSITNATFLKESQRPRCYLASWLAGWEKRKRKVNSWCESHWLSGIWWLPTDGSRIEWMQSNSCGIKTSNGPKSFKYGLSDLSSDYSIPIRDIPLTSHRSSTMIISFHGMTAYQHHDVVLQSQAISLMRSLDFVCLVCFTSLTDNCTVTCRVFFRLYCWRVRSFRFFLASDDYCWVTVAGESNCEGACEVDDLIASGVNVTICWVATCLIASCLAHL